MMALSPPAKYFLLLSFKKGGSPVREPPWEEKLRHPFDQFFTTRTEQGE